jgi:hypothetical protein
MNDALMFRRVSVDPTLPRPGWHDDAAEIRDTIEAYEFLARFDEDAEARARDRDRREKDTGGLVLRRSQRFCE